MAILRCAIYTGPGEPAAIGMPGGAFAAIRLHLGWFRTVVDRRYWAGAAAMGIQGKSVLITGATDGVGLQSAIELARMGARVNLVGRDPVKLDRAADLVAKSGRGAPPGTFLADLSSQASIRALAENVKAGLPALDVLLNNAGGYFAKRAVTPDGIEMTFGLDHLGYFLLSQLLLDLLIAAPGRSRIVNVASAAHKGVTLDFDDIQNEHYSGWRAYQRAKLANILFTYEFAARLDPAQVTVNCLHPGFVDSNFGADGGGVFGFLIGVAQKFAALSVEKGAQTQIYLCSSDEVEGVTGRYFDRCKAIRSSLQSYDTDARRKLWAVSERLTGLTP